MTGTFSVHIEMGILHKFTFIQLADAFIQSDWE